MKKVTKNGIVSNESGQAFVQFVFIIPILIIVLSMAVDLWRIFDAKLLVQSAASECAIHIVEKSDSDVDSYIRHIIYTEYKDRFISDRIKYSKTSTGNVYEENYVYHSNKHHVKGIATSNKYEDIKIEIKYDVDLIMPLSKVIFKGSKVTVGADFITRVGR